MIVIGVDLAWAHTGFAVIENGALRLTSQVNTRANQPNDARAGRLWDSLRLIKEAAEKLGKDPLWYIEKTDWHQRGRDNVSYAREREAQEALALARGVFFAFAAGNPLRYVEIGVGEWHREFGAKRKDSVAELIVKEFPQLAGESSDHITDACAIAFVGYRREKQGG